MSGRITFADERGFTLIEVLVASAILVVGLFGTLLMFDQASRATASTKAREQGIALQREIIEASRAVPYDQLTPTSIVSRVQAMPNLGDASSSQLGWTLVRRGVTYTATLGVCSVDDPADQTGTQDPATFCAPGDVTSTQCRNWLGIDGNVQGTVGAVSAAAAAGVGIGRCGIDINLDGVVDGLVQADVGLCLLGTCSGTQDSNPDDYKRVISLVRWDRGTGSRWALQSTTIPNPGLSSAPAVTAVATSASFPTPTSPARFTATTSRTPTTVAWYVDGTAQSTASNTGGAATSWWFDWSLGSVNTTVGGQPNSGEALDGSYVVSAKAFDAYGQFGATRARTVTLNRRQAYAPTGFAAGRNGSKVDFEWAPNRERDLQGYKVYRVKTGSDELVCALAIQTSCQDPSPPSGTPSYYVLAVDKDNSGNLRDGDHSASVTVALTASPPTAPSSLTVTSSSGRAALTWSQPLSLLVPVSFYRIYRDGTAFANRYDRTGDSSTRTYIDTSTGGATHQYRVTSVSANLAESAFLGPVTG